MKALGRNAVLFILLFASARASAQCGTPMAVSYDTTVAGSGSDFYTLSFPKFDPAVGSLTDVNIDAKVTLRFGYQLENTSLSTITNYKLKLDFYDDITSDALMSPLSNQKTVIYGPFTFAGSDGVSGSGTDYRSQALTHVMNQQQMGATVYNTADYMGNGPVNFDLSTASYPTIMGSAVVSYIGTVQDEVNFKITYNYCPSGVLATDITSFTANRLADGNIDIKWNSQNEKTNRKYELQKSTDGRVYRGVAEFAAQTGTSETGAYRYSYQVQPDENNKTLLFRLKLADEDRNPKFSAIRAVKITSAAATQPSLYPNPAKGTTTLQFNTKNRGNWEVEVLTISGQVAKRYFFNNALLAKLNTTNELHRGLYMVRSTNKTTQEQFIQRLLVQ